MFANQQTGAHWGHHLAEDRGPWAEEGGPPFRESRLEPVERRAPTYQEELEQQVTPPPPPPLSVGIQHQNTPNAMNVLILTIFIHKR